MKNSELALTTMETTRVTSNQIMSGSSVGTTASPLYITTSIMNAQFKDTCNFQSILNII